MKLEIKSIANKGDESEERVGLRATSDCNLAMYILFDNTYNDGEVTNEVRHSFWFPSHKVKKGDEIVVYTKEGEDFVSDKDGHKVHFFYMNMDRPVWNDARDCAVLVMIGDWEYKPVK